MNSKPIWLCVLAMWACLACGSFAKTLEPPVQNVTLRFPETLQLKDVFDWGARPYRVTTSKCQIGESQLDLWLPNAPASVSYAAEFALFRVDKYDRVTLIELSTAATSVAEAEKTLKALADALGMKLKGFDEAVARTTTDNPRSQDSWAQTQQTKWYRAFIGYRPQVYYSTDKSKGNREMRAIVNFSFEWEKTEIGPVYRENPIQPPEGYEYLTMEIPGSDLMARVQGSTNPAYAHLQIKPALSTAPAPSATETPRAPEITHPEPITAPPAPVAPPAKSSNPLWWIVGAIAALVAVVWVVARKKKPRA
jgi:hypothetical protein